jgi:hypothetical protein
MCVHSLMKHYTAIEYVTSEGQYHTKLERYYTTFSVSPYKQYITLTTSSFWNKKKKHQFVLRVDNNCHRHTVTCTFFD